MNAMTEHPKRGVHFLVAALSAAAVLLMSVSAGHAYVVQDVEITGQEIHTFADDGQTVSVVVGQFRLTLGGRVLTGRDAVLWVSQQRHNGDIYRDITAYIEGDARVLEPSGAATSDQVMLVTLRHRGRLIADARMAGAALTDFPLYKRAVAMREAERRRQAQIDAQVVYLSPKEAEPPTLVDATDISADQPVATGGADSQGRPAATQPVAFRCDSFTSEVRGSRRFTVARGNVHLSRGDPDGEMFLELSSQSAVLISEKRPPKDVRVPWAPEVRGLDTEMPGPAGLKETVVGIYLEGDVVIRRGERMMRGPIAYYDLTNDRAFVLDPVFRTVQEQRNIPIYIRAKEARALSAREIWFKDARISTSDFYSPSYHLGAGSLYLMETTPYDERQVRVGPRSMRARIRHGTFNVRSVPLLYMPYAEMDLQQGHTALRKVSAGSHGQLGWGIETQWHLFRMLGLLKPKGFKGRVDLNWYERGPVGGLKLWYSRDAFSGYSFAHGVADTEDDDFGDRRKNIEAPDNRGRILMRHKHLLPSDWQLQLELSYICDRNFLEEFYPSEFWASKEQETLAYARKQRDNWVFTSLVQQRMNRFLTQTESAPDFGFHLIGEPLLGDRLTFFSESRAGFKRYRPDKGAKATLGTDSDIFLRLDTRNEIDWPVKLGPVNLVAYAVGRATYWDDDPVDGEKCRSYGQAGLRANMHIWRLYDRAASRVWDINRLKHIITPQIVAFVGETGVNTAEIFPMDPDIETHLRRQSGVAVGVHQRLQTKRGSGDDQQTVDWMRLDITAAAYANGPDTLPADGRFFFYRPEYSLGRNHLNVDYTWSVSDSMTFMSYLNHDLNTGQIRRADAGLAVSRDPRIRYFLGMRYIKDLDSAVGVFGCNYRINRKYSVSFFEQYDFDFDGSQNMGTRLTITRKLPRWYAAFTFGYDATYDDLTLYLSIWPEGVPEAGLSSGRFSLLNRSDMN